MFEKPGENRRFLLIVMSAVGVWGSVLAIGAFLFGYDQTNGEVRFAPNLSRGLIVLGCVAVFLGGWVALLATRRAA